MASNRLNPIDFQKMISQMADVWPQIKNRGRAKRIYDAICDLDSDIAQNISNHFIDTFSKMPLPHDFVEASKAFKRHYFEKTGSYYGKQPKTQLRGEYAVSCLFCYESGFNWIKIDQLHAFCFCSCEFGDAASQNSNWLFPKFFDLTGAVRINFPKESFIPKKTEEKFKEQAFFGVVNKFTQALKESQEFWSFYAQQRGR